MKNFWKVVNQVIKDSDVLLLLLDARLIEETRNSEIEKKVLEMGRPLIYVITKSDLVRREVVEKASKLLKPCVFVSALEFHGTTKLRDRILIEGKRAHPMLKRFTVGVLGYPNVGKSSLINALKGKHSASTSKMSGHTRGVQKIKADNRIMLLDTPGVIPFKEKDPLKHALIGTIDFTRIKDPESAAFELMAMFPGKVEEHYGVTGEDEEEVLEAIAQKTNILKRGGHPDLPKVARKVLQDWQGGKIL